MINILTFPGTYWQHWVLPVPRILIELSLCVKPNLLYGQSSDHRYCIPSNSSLLLPTSAERITILLIYLVCNYRSEIAKA